MTLKYDCLQSKITFIYFYPESSNEHGKKKKHAKHKEGRVAPEISPFFPSQIKSKLFNSSVNKSLKW